MPQFDTAFLAGQIFWVIVSFGLLYLGVQFIVFPLFERIFKKRDLKIQTALEKAEQLTKKTEDLEKQIEQKKKAFEEKQKARLELAHQNAVNEMMHTLKKTDLALMQNLKNTLKKMEHEEKEVLAHSSDFIKRAMKGVR